jgi:predicted ATPase
MPIRTPPTSANGIARIRLDGYKSIEHAELPLGPLNVLIGANAAGKSNFLSVFRLLNAFADQSLQLFVGRHGGASALLHYGPKRTPRMSVGLQFRWFGNETASYSADLVHAAPDALVFADERAESLSGRKSAPKLVLGGGHRESLLGPAVEAGGLASVFLQVEDWLHRCRNYHFQDTTDQAAVKQHARVEDCLYLREDGGNLAPFLRMLRDQRPRHYADIRKTVQLVAPRFGDFLLEPTDPAAGAVLLRWKERASDYVFGPHQLSDGTLRFICLATLLLQPPDLVAFPMAIGIDEPELGLHPYAITLLAGMLEQASQRVQVIVSTQSAALVSAIADPATVIAVDRTGEASTLRRLDPAQVEPWLEDYSLGEVWEKGVLGEGVLAPRSQP